MPGLVQLQDKIVVRFALTIYPYSLGARYGWELPPLATEPLETEAVPHRILDSL